MLMNVDIREASRNAAFDVSETVKIDINELHETLMSLRTKYKYNRFIVEYDIDDNDKMKGATIVIYDDYIEGAHVCF